jgi:hypothetical protein
MPIQRRPRRNPRLDRDQKGQSLTEFALTMPILVILLVGIIVLAYIGFAYVSISSAARMGARHMIGLNPSDRPEEPDLFRTADEEITHVVTSSMFLLDWRQAEIVIKPEDTSERVYDEDVSVLITYTMELPEVRVPYIISDGEFAILGPLTLRASSQMRIY